MADLIEMRLVSWRSWTAIKYQACQVQAGTAGAQSKLKDLMHTISIPFILQMEIGLRALKNGGRT